MKLRIDLSTYVGAKIRLYQNVEYVFEASEAIVISTESAQDIFYSKCIGNGTTEVYMFVKPDMAKDEVFIRVNGRTIEVTFLHKHSVLADHLEDVTPSYIEEEYPLFKKLMRYYFEYLNLEFNPSNFIHSMERFADVDETFDEFIETISREYLPYFKDTAADRRLLSKYVLQFYNQRGTEASIRFLLRVLFSKEIDIVKQRSNLLIASDSEQGILSKAGIVMGDNYYFQLYSYIIDVSDHKFYEYKDAVYKTVNPTGYLPFGRSVVTEVENTLEESYVLIDAEQP